MRNPESIKAEIVRRKKRLKLMRNQWHRLNWRIEQSARGARGIMKNYRHGCVQSIGCQIEKLEELEAM